MKNTKQAERFNQELIASGLMPIFEIGVYKKDTLEREWIVCHIKCEGDELIATHEALNEREVKSQYIPKTSVRLKKGYSLDYHLEGIHEEIMFKIQDGGLYEYA